MNAYEFALGKRVYTRKDSSKYVIRDMKFEFIQAVSVAMLNDSAVSLQGGLPIRKISRSLSFWCFLTRLCCTAIHFVKNGVTAAFAGNG